MANNEELTVKAAIETLVELQNKIAALLQVFSESTGLDVQRVEVRPATVGWSKRIPNEYSVFVVVQLRGDE